MINSFARRIQCGFCKQLTSNWAYSLESFYRGTNVRKKICLNCAYDREEIIAYDTTFFKERWEWESKDGMFGAGGSRQFVEGFEERVEKIREQIRTGQRAFRAKYPGICIECDKRINTGEPIYFQTMKGIWHQNCKNAEQSVGWDEILGEEIKEPETTILTTGRKFRLVR
jgi:hypothetical protein